MTEIPIVPSVIVTALIIFAVVFCARYFRVLINDNALSGMDPDSARRFIKSQSFGKRLFMTYIWKHKHNWGQRFGLEIWFLVWHCIHIVVSIAFFAILWLEISSAAFFDRVLQVEFAVLGIHVTRGAFGNLLVVLIVASLPASILLAAPFIWHLKKIGG